MLAGRRVAEDLLPHRVDLRAVVDVGEVHRHLDDVLEAAARLVEHHAHVGEHLPRLRRDVFAAHERPVPVDTHQAGDEEQLACNHSVCVVRDRLGQPICPDLTPGHLAAACSSLSRTRGLICSGSTGSSSSAGSPEPRARSNAASKSAVRSTRSPKPP